MTAPLCTIERDCKVGIYDNCHAVARIYEDRTVVTMPEVRWVGNSGNLHESRYRISGSAHEEIKEAMSDDCDDTAWRLIYEYAH